MSGSLRWTALARGEWGSRWGRAWSMPGSWCIHIWRVRFNERIVRHDGLTDAILAHSRLEPWRPGHYKQPMDTMALDLSNVQAEYCWGRGTYRRAVEDGKAAAWIAANLDTIELLERKIHNRHDLLENLILAFSPVPKIEPPRTDAGHQATSSQQSAIITNLVSITYGDRSE